MGVYNRLDVAFQEAMEQAGRNYDRELADTVAWYRAHYEQLPPELMRAILTDDTFFEKAVHAWDSDRFPPKPTSEHVAVQMPIVSKDDLASIRLYKAVVGWSLIAGAFFTAVIIVLVNL
jgi:hypothetical protein